MSNKHINNSQLIKDFDKAVGAFLLLRITEPMKAFVDKYKSISSHINQMIENTINNSDSLYGYAITSWCPNEEPNKIYRTHTFIIDKCLSVLCATEYDSAQQQWKDTDVEVMKIK